MKMSASRSHSMQLCQPNFFTPIPKFIVSYLARFFNRFQHVLGFEPTRKILIPSGWAVKELRNAKPNGHPGEGDLDAWS